MHARNIAGFLIVVMLIAACSTKKKPSLSGEDEVDVKDFIEFFPELKAPFQAEDTFLLRKNNDSLRISRKVLTQFVPDSIITELTGAKAKPNFYPIGRLDLNETYLLVKSVQGNKRAALLLAFDEKDQFVAAMKFLAPDDAANTREWSVLSKKEEIYNHTSRRNSNGTVDEGRKVYVLNNAAREFMLIQTDALDKKPTEIINPIDTLSQKMKYTADYGSGKMNLFSFRDGRKSDRLNFFIHFEKNNGECTGELKGEAILKAPNIAEYREPGEPCVLRFTFTNTAVTVKEVEPCGSRRGLRCSFDGTYSRKKAAKPATSSKKK